MISITDNRGEEPVHFEYQYEGGISEYVDYINTNKVRLHDSIIYCEGTIDDINVEIAMQYTDSYTTNLYSFTNNIPTHEGGTHEEGFRATLTRILNAYGNKNNLFKKDESFTGDDTREGLTAIISVKHPDPQFEGQTKTKLGNTEVRAIVSKILSDGLDRYLLENPSSARIIIEKAMMASRARIAAK